MKKRQREFKQLANTLIQHYTIQNRRSVRIDLFSFTHFCFAKAYANCVISSRYHVANACGTIGILHSVAAVSDLTGGPATLKAGSWFDTFLRSTLDKSPEERAAELEVDEGAAECHDEVVAQGQSEVVDDTWKCVLCEAVAQQSRHHFIIRNSPCPIACSHFIALVHKGGSLYEMDGRKDGPINHGPTTADSFLQVCVPSM